MTEAKPWIRYAAASDIGRVRKNNEDSFLADPSLGIFAVADGMGGHASGEIASQLAVESLRESIRKASQEKAVPAKDGDTVILSSPATILSNSIRKANQRIYRSAQENAEWKGMGTTLVAVYFPDHSPVVGHVGDSRLYLLRQDTILQVTEDHSLVWEEYKQGRIPKEAIPLSPVKNVITRSLGPQLNVDVDLKELETKAGDLLLLCSDGLSDLVQDEEMLREVNRAAGDLEGACRRLIDLANSRGGKDNITVLLISFG